MSGTGGLTRISLTGLDNDSVDIIEQCVSVSAYQSYPFHEYYPFAEWAFLYYPEGMGRPRNPDAQTQEMFYSAFQPCHTATHLCGIQAFEQLLEDKLPNKMIIYSDRIQLNVNPRRMDFNDREVQTIYRKALRLGKDIILQYNNNTEENVKQFVSGLTDRQRHHVHILLDHSCGLGIVPSEWHIPKFFRNMGLMSGYHMAVGFAGGINPDNVTEVLEEIESHPYIQKMTQGYWIDMESGIRTDNKFDIEKAKTVLHKARDICFFSALDWRKDFL